MRSTREQGREVSPETVARKPTVREIHAIAARALARCGERFPEPREPTAQLRGEEPEPEALVSEC